MHVVSNHDTFDFVLGKLYKSVHDTLFISIEIIFGCREDIRLDCEFISFDSSCHKSLIFSSWGKDNILLSQKQNFAIKNIKFVILATQNNIKFVIVSIKFVIVRATFPRIMRAREDRHKQSLYMTEIRLLSGWFPGNRKGNKREKDKNTPPFFLGGGGGGAA